MHFHYKTYMATPQHQNPCPGGHDSYNFGRPFLGHHYYYLLSLSDLCPRVKKKVFKEIMHFHYMTYMATPQHKNPCPGVMKVTISVDPSLVMVTITIHLVCLNHAPEQRSKLFYETHQFYTFNHKIPSFQGGGHVIYNFLCPDRTDATYQIWIRLAQYFLRRRCKRMTDDDGRQPITIGHMSYLKITYPEAKKIVNP